MVLRSNANPVLEIEWVQEKTARVVVGQLMDQLPINCRELVLAGRVTGESRHDDQHLMGREEPKKIKTVDQKRYARPGRRSWTSGSRSGTPG